MMDNWQPIDSAPRDYSRILVCGGDVGGPEMAYRDADGNVWCEHWEDRRISTDPPDNPTHWQPLPSPPADARGGGR